MYRLDYEETYFLRPMGRSVSAPHRSQWNLAVCSSIEGVGSSAVSRIGFKQPGQTTLGTTESLSTGNSQLGSMEPLA
jgi:hypothetical protein